MTGTTTTSATIVEAAAPPPPTTDSVSVMEQQQQTFPFKLYEMIEHAHESGFTSALSWLPSGNAFSIHNKGVMMNDLAPMFFKQTKFRSFVSKSVCFCMSDCYQHQHRILLLLLLGLKSFINNVSSPTSISLAFHLHLCPY